MNIREISFWGLRWSIVEKVSLAIVGFVQLLVVVRYIGKADLGLMAILNTVLSFAGIFSDLGLGNSILHKQEKNHNKLSSLFWFYVMTGVLLNILFVLISPILAYFFEERALTPVMIIASFTFSINGFALLYQAIFYKELDFRVLSQIQIAVTGASFFCVIILAVLGYGVYALVIGVVVRSTVNVIFLTLAGKKYFIPSLYFKMQEVREHIRFAIFQTGERIINTINTQSDVLIVGKLLGTEVLGVYDIFKQLLSRPMQLINPVITRISLPVLAKVQAEPARAGNLYIRQIQYLASVNFPIYIFLALSSEPVIYYFLTETWLSPTTNLLFILFCMYYMVYTIQNPIGTLIIATGQVHRSFYYNLVILFFLPFLIVWAATKGITVLLSCMLIFHALMIFAAYEVLLIKAAHVPLKDFLYAILLPLVLSFTAFGGIGLISSFLPLNGLSEAIVTLLLGGGGYLVFSLKWNRPFIEEAVSFFSSMAKWLH